MDYKTLIENILNKLPDEQLEIIYEFVKHFKS